VGKNAVMLMFDKAKELGLFDDKGQQLILD
jgi:hypothetical protein